MGYVEGQSLADRLKHGPLSPREAAQLGRTIAVAIDYAHVRGIVHRDLKPGNILITTAGTPRITDFGLAKMGVDDSLTQSGVLAGTPEYMSPEQTLTEPLDARTDLFSLGAVLYTACTG